MNYSLTYKPSKSRNKYWLLKIWEPTPKVVSLSQHPAPYLYKVQYWLGSRDEAEALLAEHLQQYGVRPIAMSAA